MSPIYIKYPFIAIIMVYSSFVNLFYSETKSMELLVMVISAIAITLLLKRKNKASIRKHMFLFTIAFVFVLSGIEVIGWVLEVRTAYYASNIAFISSLIMLCSFERFYVIANRKLD